MGQRKRAAKSATPIDKSQLTLEITVAGEVFRFSPDLFDLADRNTSELSMQIAQIPAEIAYVGVALARAEAVAKAMQTEYDVWWSRTCQRFAQDYKQVNAREAAARNAVPKEYTQRQTALQSAQEKVTLLKNYRSALDAKFQLSQTLSANIRAEREALRRGQSV